jgi:hypothetical protein
MLRAVEQVIGREGETATLLSRRPLNFKLNLFAETMGTFRF